MQTNSKKKVGSREEVYNDMAKMTSGRMYKDDIIKKNIVKRKEKGTVTRYLSKKISDRMKNNHPNIRRKKTKTNTNTNKNINKINQYQNKSKKNTNLNLKTNMNGNYNKKRTIKFNINNNIVKEYYCPKLELNIQKEILEKKRDRELVKQLDSINIDDIEEINLEGLF